MAAVLGGRNRTPSTTRSSPRGYVAWRSRRGPPQHAHLILSLFILMIPATFASFTRRTSSASRRGCEVDLAEEAARASSATTATPRWPRATSARLYRIHFFWRQRQRCRPIEAAKKRGALNLAMEDIRRMRRRVTLPENIVLPDGTRVGNIVPEKCFVHGRARPSRCVLVFESLDLAAEPRPLVRGPRRAPDGARRQLPGDALRGRPNGSVDAPRCSRLKTLDWRTRQDFDGDGRVSEVEAADGMPAPQSLLDQIVAQRAEVRVQSGRERSRAKTRARNNV